MNIFLAGEHTVKNGSLATGDGAKILESFYYCRKNPYVVPLMKRWGDFILDSGAFTFMQGAGAVDWDRYTQEYAEWIAGHGVRKFFELDIDAVIGLKEVERLRRKIERITGKQPIPVWHLQRGKDYFIGMCKDYKYVAIGGLVGTSRAVKLDSAFPWLINTAHEYGAKIHGLGYTKFKELRRYHFDSVDSTAWLYGNRGGFLYMFDPHTGEMLKKQVPAGKKLKSQEAAAWNLNEWIKFQKYAEKNL